MCASNWHIYVLPSRPGESDQGPEGQGEEDVLGVDYSSANHVVHLPPPLHVPCWGELLTSEENDAWDR